MATQKDFIMSRSGPEDALVAVRTNVNSSGLRTAGPDWAVLSNEKFQMDSLDYPDIAEQQRLSAQVLSAGPSGQILRELISRRDICARQAYVNTVRCWIRADSRDSGVTGEGCGAIHMARPT